MKQKRFQAMNRSELTTSQNLSPNFPRKFIPLKRTHIILQKGCAEGGESCERTRRCSYCTVHRTFTPVSIKLVKSMLNIENKLVFSILNIENYFYQNILFITDTIRHLCRLKFLVPCIRTSMQWRAEVLG